jgi:AcrR family transcriptional regulator
VSTTDAQPRLGRRERKKQQTRQHIGDTARRLFIERGFDRVSIAEIADAADVADQTVFNYFPTKEDLVFWRLAEFEDTLLTAVRERAAGESALTAFRRFLLAQRGLLGRTDPEARADLDNIARLIADSPALLAREQQIVAGYTDALANLLTDETGANPGDITPHVVASAMIGIHRALIHHTRAHILAGTPHTALARDVRRQAEHAFTALANGLGDYATKP